MKGSEGTSAGAARGGATRSQLDVRSCYAWCVGERVGRRIDG